MYNRVLVTLSFLFFFLLSIAFFLGPYAFKISNQLRISDSPYEFSPGYKKDNKFPLKLLSELTTERKGGIVWATRSDDRFNSTLKAGLGNCSNLVYGLGARLYQEGYPFDVVHLLNPIGLLSGNGHTVITLPYEYENITSNGFYDVLENGFPLNKLGEFANWLDVENNNFNDADGYVHSPIKGNKHKSIYWDQKFIKKSVLGIMKGEEIARYFSITDKIFMRFENQKLERYFLDGSALFFGYLPKVYISRENYDKLMELDVNKYHKYISNILLDLMRIIASAIASILMFQLYIQLRLFFKNKAAP